MRRTISLPLPLLALAVLAAPIWAAGGSSVPSTDPADQAADAYNRGLQHRDKAWDLEKQVGSVVDEKEKARLESKIQKEYEKASRAFRSATESNPRMYQAHSSLGYALRKLGAYQDSLESYDRALKIRPDYSEAIEYRGQAYLGLDRLAEAKEAYMELFRGDRERADELMSAMQRWVDERQADPGSLEPSVIEEFSAWVKERSEVSAQTASLGRDPARGW